MLIESAIYPIALNNQLVSSESRWTAPSSPKGMEGDLPGHLRTSDYSLKKRHDDDFQEWCRSCFVPCMLLGFLASQCPWLRQTTLWSVGRLLTFTMIGLYAKANVINTAKLVCNHNKLSSIEWGAWPSSTKICVYYKFIFLLFSAPISFKFTANFHKEGGKEKEELSGYSAKC